MTGIRGRRSDTNLNWFGRNILLIECFAVSRRDINSICIADEGGVLDAVEEILRGEQEGAATDDECQGRRRDPRLGNRNNVSELQ